MVEAGQPVVQQTLGWDDARGTTVAQRSKEFAEDYRYFPEPDLPPLVVDEAWVEEIRAALPELPAAKRKRFMAEFGLNAYDAGVLVADRPVAEFYEAVVAAARQVDAKLVANWISGALFGLMNESGVGIEELKFSSEDMARLLDLLAEGELNSSGARKVLVALFEGGGDPLEIVERRGLKQLSDSGQLAAWVAEVLDANPEQVAGYLEGKAGVLNWLFGQVMRAAGGKANPQQLREELNTQLSARQNARVQ
jgi:aspartyl-tRNA(Asn)/glutamyl-tRNA(Gln) amidotransferase subunit B